MQFVYRDPLLCLHMQDMLASRKSVGNLTGRLLVNSRPATSTFIAHTSYVQQVRDHIIIKQVSH